MADARLCHLQLGDIHVTLVHVFFLVEYNWRGIDICRHAHTKLDGVNLIFHVWMLFVRIILRLVDKSHVVNLQSAIQVS